MREKTEEGDAGAFVWCGNTRLRAFEKINCGVNVGVDSAIRVQEYGVESHVLSMQALAP